MGKEKVIRIHEYHLLLPPIWLATPYIPQSLDHSGSTQELLLLWVHCWDSSSSFYDISSLQSLQFLDANHKGNTFALIVTRKLNQCLPQIWILQNEIQRWPPHSGLGRTQLKILHPFRCRL